MGSEPVGGSEGLQGKKYGSKAELAKDRSRTAWWWLVLKWNLVYTPGVLRRENNRAEALSKYGEHVSGSFG